MTAERLRFQPNGNCSKMPPKDFENERIPELSDHKFRGRREDLRLLTGQGRYTADYDFMGQVAGHFLRADRAHAKIARIDTTAARKLPGVLDVLTGADLVATGWKGVPAMAFFKG